MNKYLQNEIIVKQYCYLKNIFKPFCGLTDGINILFLADKSAGCGYSKLLLITFIWSERLPCLWKTYSFHFRFNYCQTKTVNYYTSTYYHDPLPRVMRQFRTSLYIAFIFYVGILLVVYTIYKTISASLLIVMMWIVMTYYVYNKTISLC